LNNWNTIYPVRADIGRSENIVHLALGKQSDSNVLALLPKIASHFVSAEVRHFKGDDEVEALAWIDL
jgi:hypothetical protein